MKELNCNEVLNQWENFGDNSPIEYGTKFVKADEEMKDCYYVIEVVSPWVTGADGWLLSYGYVDLADEWIDWKAIKEFAGFDNTCQDTEKGYMVSALVEYYGSIEFQGEPLDNDFEVCENGVYNIVNKAETITLLNKYGILLERSEEVMTVTIINYNDSELIYTMKEDVESIGETVDGEGIVLLDDNTKFIVSESLEQLRTLLEGYDVEVMEEEGDGNE